MARMPALQAGGPRFESGSVHYRDLTDYSNLHMAVNAGSAWVKVTREYTTPDRSFRLVLLMTKGSYLVMMFDVEK